MLWLNATKFAPFLATNFISLLIEVNFVLGHFVGFPMAVSWSSGFVWFTLLAKYFASLRTETKIRWPKFCIDFNLLIYVLAPLGQDPWPLTQFAAIKYLAPLHVAANKINSRIVCSSNHSAKSINELSAHQLWPNRRVGRRDFSTGESTTQSWLINASQFKAINLINDFWWGHDAAT